MQNDSIVRQRNEGERKMIANGEMSIIAEGRLGAIIRFPMLVDMGQGYVAKDFERFVRPPGTRIIALKDRKIYLQKEHRLETNNAFDWRLPGGKVVDSFAEYKQYIGNPIPNEVIIEAGKKELYEEAKLAAEKLSILKKSPCGASVEWDLYYLLAENISETDHAHDEGEEIIDGKWFSFDEILQMCKNGDIDEDRTVATLYQFISKNS